MKLRVKSDAVRLRLTRSEVSTLGREGCLEDRIRFGPSAVLAYRVRADAEANELTASYDGRAIDVRIPAAQLEKWCRSDEVTLSAVQQRSGIALSVIVEKDFACLAPRAGEDESDNFPHPLADTAQHGRRGD